MAGVDRPGGLTALAVVNFVWGGISGISALLSFLAYALGAAAQPPLDAVAPAVLWGAAGAGFVLAGLLVLSGIGYLLGKRVLGRYLGNLYALGDLANNGVVIAAGLPFQFAMLPGLVYPVITLVLLNTVFKHDLVR